MQYLNELYLQILEEDKANLESMNTNSIQHKPILIAEKFMIEVSLFLDQFQKVNKIGAEQVDELNNKDETLYKIDP